MIPEDFNTESEINRELIVAKFKSFAMEKFQESIETDVDPEEFLSGINRHFSLNLPEGISEYFLLRDQAPLLWLSNHPAVTATGDILKTEKIDSILLKKQSAEINEIKKFYGNWVFQKNEKEKQYFALSTINLIEKESKNKDFIKQLIHATILAYEKSINSPENAVQLLYKTKEAVDTSITFNPDLRRELSYIINLFIGFIYLKEHAVNEANQKFAESLSIKQTGVSGMFYSALSQIIIGNQGKALEYILGIIKLDKARFAVAIKNNNMGLFSYFLMTAYIYNVFNQKEFAILLNDLDFSLKTFISPDQSSLEKLGDRLETLSSIQVNEFYDDEIKGNIQFIERFLDLYKTNNNFLISCVTEFLGEKLNGLLAKIVDNIKNHYYEKAKEVLQVYNLEIEKSENNIKVIKRELEDTKLKSFKKVEDRIKLSEQEAAEQILGLENRINNLESDTKYNPGSSFNSAMIYNIIISLIVFIIGGFGSGFGSGGEGADSFRSIFSTIIVNGIQWGGITFLIGIIVSFFTATSAIWERSNEKNRLIKQIGVVKIYKDKEIEEIKIEQERYVKAYELNFGHRIQQLEKTIERVAQEKTDKSKEIYDNANTKIRDISVYLESLKIVF